MEIKLGDNIRQLRKGSGLTQEQLAEALGVTTGAVYKWESGKATPELEMLVDIAEFFETSVDVLLNYGWEKMSMGKTVEKLRQFQTDKNLDEGMRFAEKALQKYPSSFDVVYHSATIFFLTMGQKNMPRAVELYEKAISLIDQNTDDEINVTTLQNSIASCYCRMDRMDEAISIFKKNNVGGTNNAVIGLLLSQNVDKADLVSDSKYLHIQRTDSGFDYTLYDKNSMKQLDGGQFDDPELHISTACIDICEMHGLDSYKANIVPLELLESRFYVNSWGRAKIKN